MYHLNSGCCCCCRRRCRGRSAACSAASAPRKSRHTGSSGIAPRVRNSSATVASWAVAELSWALLATSPPVAVGGEGLTSNLALPILAMSRAIRTTTSIAVRVAMKSATVAKRWADSLVSLKRIVVLLTCRQPPKLCSK